MSIVAIKITNNTITIGCDSQVTNYGIYKEDIQKRYGLGKVIRENGMIIGSVGLLSEISYMRLFMKTNKPLSSREDDILNYFVTFYKFCKEFDSTFKPFNSWIMIFQKRVFLIESDLSIYEIQNHIAIGSGMFHATPILELGMSVKESVKMACKLDLYCAEPINLFRVKR